MKKAIFYTIALFVGFVVATFFAFWITVSPPKSSFDVVPVDYDMSAEEVTLKGEGDIDLKGWFLETEQSPESALILLHDYTASKSHMLPIAKRLYPDFSLLVLDMRGSGESDGRFSSLGLKESRDISNAVDYLSNNGYENIGIYGLSLGGAVGLRTASMNNNVDAVASVSSFADLRSLGYQRFDNLYALKYPMVEAIGAWGRIIFGESMSKANPIRVVDQITAPVLLMHGRADRQVPFSHAKRLEQARASASSTTQTEFFDGGVPLRTPENYDQTLRLFFEKHLNQ